MTISLPTLLAAAIIAMPAVIAAQAPAPSADATAPTCRQTLDSLDSRLRLNYAGFMLEVRGIRRAAYDSVLSARRRDADATALDECYPVLRSYIESFDDPHLFVYQNPVLDSTTARARAAAIRKTDVTEATARAYLARRSDALDPIEGIWYDGPTRYAVLADPESVPGRFMAVLLAPDSTWPAGAVRGTFTRTGDGAYDARLSSPNFAIRQLPARLHKRVLLRLSPGMWGKEVPVTSADTGLLDETDAHRPRLSIRARSVLVSIPSHDPAYTRLLDSLVAATMDEIRDRGLLIVDLRGNEGGASFMSRALDPLIASAVRRATPYDSGRAVMLSSPAQISYARRFTGSDTSAFVRSLVRRLEANPGALVTLWEGDEPARPDSVAEGDWRVAVLVDRGTVSASEVLVLKALRSTRATVFGEPTAGALDYQSTQVLSLRTGDRRWALGYPTITAHADLPNRGMRGKGIAPDVRVDWRAVGDPIAAIEQRMSNQR
jgi:hypothetical protein